MRLLLFTPILFVFLSATSCCKFPSEAEPIIWITYRSTKPIGEVYQIRTEKHDLSKVVDTLVLKNIRYWHPHARRSPYDSVITVQPSFIGDYNHIIMSFDSTRFDTIIYVSHARGRCNILQEVVYFWNGEYSTDPSREVKQSPWFLGILGTKFNCKLGLIFVTYI